MDNSEIVFSKPIKYKNVSSSETIKGTDICTGKTCNDKCCFC